MQNVTVREALNRVSREHVRAAWIAADVTVSNLPERLRSGEPLWYVVEYEHDQLFRGVVEMVKTKSGGGF
jgi:hypothetical protein